VIMRNASTLRYPDGSWGMQDAGSRRGSATESVSLLLMTLDDLAVRDMRQEGLAILDRTSEQYLDKLSQNQLQEVYYHAICYSRSPTLLLHIKIGLTYQRQTKQDPGAETGCRE